MPTLRVYAYANCDTCRKALKFLDREQIAYEEIPIVERPPSPAELRAMLALVGDVRKLFNTSGLLYREMALGKKLPTMSEDEAIALLAKHGKLVKRPFALAGGVGLVGFNEAAWKTVLAKR